MSILSYLSSSKLDTHAVSSLYPLGTPSAKSKSIKIESQKILTVSRYNPTNLVKQIAYFVIHVDNVQFIDACRSKSHHSVNLILQAVEFTSFKILDTLEETQFFQCFVAEKYRPIPNFNCPAHFTEYIFRGLYLKWDRFFLWWILLVRPGRVEDKKCSYK